MRLIIFFFCLSQINLIAQQSDSLSVSRYEMADKLRWSNISQNVYNVNVTPHWKTDNTGFWFSEFSKEGTKYKHLSFADMEVLDIFDHKVLRAKLKEEFDIETDAYNLGLNDLKFLSKNIISFNVSGKRFNYDFTKNELAEKAAAASSNTLEAASPNGKWIAYVQDHNLFVRQRDTDTLLQLSTAGEKGFEYASHYGWFDKMEGEQGERPERLNVNWSPDSKKIYCNIVDLRNASKMFMLDNSVDSLYRPKLLSYYRGSPGDTNIVYFQPVVFDIEKQSKTKIDIDPVPHFMGIYPNWDEQSSELFLTHWERGFRKVSISQVNLDNGELQDLYSEESEIGIEYTAFVPYYSDENDCFIFTSENNGWKQLYHFNPKDKKVTSITNGDYFINEVEHINEERKIIYFTASGKESDRNPYHMHLYRVDFDGGNLKLLTPENAHHNVSISKDGSYFLDNYSTHDQATKTVLRDTDQGKVITHISEADITYLDTLNWEAPQSFCVKAGDGITDIYGVIYKPTDFDSTKSYPILDATYTGPHTSRYPKSFYSTIRSNSPAMAELGFVLIRVDGRGSNNRSRDFRCYSYKNLGGGLDDHIVAMRTLAKKHSWIDLDRVGIFGHSAGGYDAGRALLAYPDFYKVGVASSADHDHRMEKAWWPEMYMGWPVDKTYDKQSNITNAKNLKGKLLLVHGALDDNVNISATLKLSEALVKANKEFDLLIFPSQRHGYSGKYAEYFAKKRWNYFVEHLLHKTPRWDYDLKEEK